MMRKRAGQNSVGAPEQKKKRVKRLASLGTTDIEVETWTERDDQLLKAMLLKY